MEFAAATANFKADEMLLLLGFVVAKVPIVEKLDGRVVFWVDDERLDGLFVGKTTRSLDVVELMGWENCYRLC